MSRDNFEQQFFNKINIEGVQVIQLKHQLKVEKSLIIFAPGWARTERTFQEALKVLYQCQRNIITVAHPRWGGEVLTKSNLENIPQETQRRATTLSKLIKSAITKNKQGIDCIAQSMGALDLLTALTMVNDREIAFVNNIVLINSAGLMKADSFLSLGKRFIQQMKQNIQIKKDNTRTEKARQNASMAGSEFLKYVGKNPIRSFKEVRALANAQAFNLLQEAKNRGVKIAIIHSNDDLLFH
jgi:hypothetical protein